jgi:hypothetical protein
MPMWRCPHCGTPQAETARCWVCRRSSTACATCRHFRRSVAAQVGYCGLDRQRRPLKGDEIRACWEAGFEPVELPVVSSAATGSVADDGLRDRTPVRRLEFVEVSPGPARARGRVAGTAAKGAESEVAMAADPAPAPAPEPTWSLWGDAEP